nr:glycosyltransferase family 4 protein [uncultured Carboxylicivirga sp.]
MRPIKILETIRQGKIGGGESHVLDLVNHLDQTRFKPVVLSFTYGPMVDILKENGIQTKVIETEKPFDKRVRIEVEQLMKNENIDLVHAHGTRALSNTYRSANKLKLPLIYTVHGWSFHQDQPFVMKFLRKQAEKFLSSKATSTICVSKSNQQTGQRDINLQRSEVINNAINLEKFNPNRDYEPLREQLGFTDNHYVVGFIARMTVQKEPLTLVKAMKHIASVNDNIQLLMVGDGELKEQTINLVNKLGLQRRVIFEPFRQDIPNVLNGIDLYCLPSLWEGFPIGILEAMAMRKPVLATPVDGTVELIEHNHSGFLVEEKNPEKLAESILSIYNDKILSDQVADNAYKKVVSNYSIQQLVQKVEAVYAKYA